MRIRFVPSSLAGRIVAAMLPLFGCAAPLAAQDANVLSVIYFDENFERGDGSRAAGDEPPINDLFVSVDLLPEAVAPIDFKQLTLWPTEGMNGSQVCIRMLSNDWAYRGTGYFQITTTPSQPVSQFWHSNHEEELKGYNNDSLFAKVRLSEDCYKPFDTALLALALADHPQILRVVLRLAAIGPEVTLISSDPKEQSPLFKCKRMTERSFLRCDLPWAMVPSAGNYKLNVAFENIYGQKREASVDLRLPEIVAR